MAVLIVVLCLAFKRKRTDRFKENILLESNGDYSSLKLIDFGLACRYEGKPLREIVGKFHYCSPQVFKPSGYGPKADVWSCGVVAYICLGGFAPFDSPRELVIRDLVLEGAISFDDPEWKCISEEAKDFVKALLTYDEADRPSAKEVLQHPFITRIVKDATENFRRSSLGSASAALENMRSFSATTKLKEMICTFIAAQLLEKEEKEEIDKLFRAMVSCILLAVSIEISSEDGLLGNY